MKKSKAIILYTFAALAIVLLVYYAYKTYFQIKNFEKENDWDLNFVDYKKQFYTTKANLHKDRRGNVGNEWDQRRLNAVSKYESSRNSKPILEDLTSTRNPMHNNNNSSGHKVDLKPYFPDEPSTNDEPSTKTVRKPSTGSNANVALVPNFKGDSFAFGGLLRKKKGKKRKTKSNRKQKKRH